MEKMISVKSSLLKQVREYYKVTLPELCERTKIKVEKLEQFEAGWDYPSYAQLEKIANFYNKPVFFFFGEGMVNSEDIIPALRKIEKNYGESSLSKQTMELLEKAAIYRRNLKELYEGEKCTSFSALISQCTSQEDLIKTLREKLDLELEKQSSFQRPEDLLEYLRDEFYELGVYIFKDSFKNDEISGLCVYDDVFPIVLLNNKTSFTRQIFTLFHEIYHLYLKEADLDHTYNNEETECNTFASEFLIPNEDLRKKLEEIDDIEDEREIDRLAKRYNVSRDAVMYRLVKMKLLELDFYADKRIGFFRNMSASTGGNFYYTKMSYLGQPYLNKIFSSYYAGKLTKLQVGMYTGLKSVHLPKIATKMTGGAL
jgi:Zn-dependent peptidase ImmA (M78 family)